MDDLIIPDLARRNRCSDLYVAEYDISDKSRGMLRLRRDRSTTPTPTSNTLSLASSLVTIFVAVVAVAVDDGGPLPVIDDEDSPAVAA